MASDSDGASLKKVASSPLVHEVRFLQQPEMAGHAGLRDPEDAGELADVQLLEAEQPQSAGGLVAKQPEQRRGRVHIYKSTLMYGCLARRVVRGP